MIATMIDQYAPVLALAAYVLSVAFLLWLVTRKEKDHDHDRLLPRCY